MRLKLFIGFVFLLILVSGVSALGQCEDSQVIMRLSDDTNAHGGLWDAENYETKVCYNDFFAGDYIGQSETEMHDSQSEGANLVIELSRQNDEEQKDNSHGQVEGDRNYPNIVFYGDLTCEQKEACDANTEATILSLSGGTNAHLALGDYSTYGTKLCCSSASNDPICEGPDCGETPSDDFTIDIIKPKNDDKYCINQEITFDQDSKSPVQYDVIWNFGDTETETLNNCLDNDCDTTHSYSESGTYYIGAQAKQTEGDSPQTIQADGRVGILLHKEGINKFAKITKPTQDEVSETGRVDFDGSESYIAVCDYDVNNLDSSLTYENDAYPVECGKSESGEDLGTLYCRDLSKDEDVIGNEYEFWFEWIIKKINDNDEVVETTVVGGETGGGKWSTNYGKEDDKVVEFRKRLTKGKYSTQLNVGYEKL